MEMYVDVLNLSDFVIGNSCVKYLTYHVIIIYMIIFLIIQFSLCIILKETLKNKVNKNVPEFFLIR